MEGKTIIKVVKEQKKIVEKALVDKSFEIITRVTPFVEKNLKLNTRDKKGNHPQYLGDYDILAYYPQKNVVINIEPSTPLLPKRRKTIKGNNFWIRRAGVRISWETRTKGRILR